MVMLGARLQPVPLSELRVISGKNDNDNGLNRSASGLLLLTYLFLPPVALLFDVDILL